MMLGCLRQSSTPVSCKRGQRVRDKVKRTTGGKGKKIFTKGQGDCIRKATDHLQDNATRKEIMEAITPGIFVRENASSPFIMTCGIPPKCCVIVNFSRWRLSEMY